MTTLSAMLDQIPRLFLHVSMQNGWWIIEQQRPDKTWARVRRCKGTKDQAQACVTRYLHKQGSNIGVVEWF